MISERVTVKRIGPTSALKVGATVGLLVGVLYFVLALLSFIEIDDTMGRLLLFVIMLLPGVVFGGISGLVTAWFYNIAFNLTGGLRLEVSFGRDGDGVDKGVAPSIGSMMSNDE